MNKEKKGFFLLGATGTVGEMVLKAAKHLNLKLQGFTFHTNYEKALKIINEFSPEFVITNHEENYKKLKKENLKIKILYGMQSILQKIQDNKVTTVVNCLAGIVGLVPSWETIELGKKLIISNKESIVSGGGLLVKKQQYENQLIPLDSEHWSIFLLLQNIKRGKVKEIMLTASGGPFLKYSPEEMKNITLNDALNHPIWNMGKHITISSATMANKGLEVLEAKELFGFNLSEIKVLVHPQALVHGLIRLKDGSILGHFDTPSMYHPVKNALIYPDMEENENFSLRNSFLEFKEVDKNKFPLLELAYEAGNKGHSFQIIYTVANEIAVNFFLAKKINFNKIADSVDKILNSFQHKSVDTIDDILGIHEEAILKSEEILKRISQ